MPASVEPAEIARLLEEYEQLTHEGKATGPIVAILACRTRFPDLEQFLLTELIERHRDADEVAKRLSSRPPTLGASIGQGILRGVAVGMMGLFVAGFIWGAVDRPAPCGRAKDFFTGGMLGIAIFAFRFGGPIAAASCFLGAILGVIAPHRR